VTVSLNRGTALVQLAPENKVTLEQIQRLVRKSGFTPKQARVRVEGRLTRRDAALFLNAGKAQHALAPAPSAKEQWAALEKLASGQLVRVEGQAPGDGGKTVRIKVTGFVALSSAGRRN
jgi:hypothetical protein